MVLPCSWLASFAKLRNQVRHELHIGPFAKGAETEAFVPLLLKVVGGVSLNSQIKLGCDRKLCR